MKSLKLYSILILASLTSCLGGGAKCASPTKSTLSSKPKEYSYIVNESYPHSRSSYTQGLQIVDGELFESTGLNGASRLMRVNLLSGEQERLIASLDDSEFGEGITILGDTIYMLTWQSGVAHLFSRESGKRIDSRLYSGEGWGVTSDGDRLYMSNGSNRITVRDRESFKILSSHSVTLRGEPLPLLNELEWIEGKIWANVYTTNMIVIIDPSSWQVVGVIDLTGILPDKERDSSTDLLNGIAYDQTEKKIYVTGKNWSRLFEIEIVER